MLTLLPSGLMGLVIAALIAALMSTISTHLNWGSSYIVNDFYLRFMNKDASQKDQVRVGRITTVILMILAAIMALFLTNAMQAFNILLQIGAGTGLLFLLRWFWWRINAYSEIVAMIVSFIIAIYFEMIYQGSLEPYQRMVIGVGLTSLSWLGATFLTRPTAHATLVSFYMLIRPHKIGWSPVVQKLDIDESYSVDSSLAKEIFMMFIGCIMVYAALFGVGYFLYGRITVALIALVLSAACALLLARLWK